MELDESNKQKDLKLIKILHNIQNPVYAININMNNCNDLFDTTDQNIEKMGSNDTNTNLPLSIEDGIDKSDDIKSKVI
jgi:hypothetical protein